VRQHGAYTATIKITQGIIVLLSDTTVFELQNGTNQQFVRKIASLKGQVSHSPSVCKRGGRIIILIYNMTKIIY
jgi:hypothetical protein